MTDFPSRQTGSLLRLLGLMVVALAASCTAAGSEADAINRGDEAFARGDVAEALAEYRLALRQGGDSPDVLMRAAHAYARSGRIDEAREHYARAIAMDGELAGLAVSDLLRVARAAVDRNDGIRASAAVEAAIRLEPGVSVSGLALPLARHFSATGQFGEALPWYQRAVVEGGESVSPEIQLEMARVQEEIGDCERALLVFEEVRPRVPSARRSEVDWHVGSCSFILAEEAREAGFAEDALQLYRATIDVGQPPHRIGRAWFEVGEILATRGECRPAVSAFEEAAEADIGGGALSRQALDRVDEILFGTGDGPC